MTVEVTVVVDLAPDAEITGFREDLTAYLEQFGDIRRSSVKKLIPEQLRLEVYPSRIRPLYTSPGLANRA